jgi:hypothetical protein
MPQSAPVPRDLPALLAPVETFAGEERLLSPEAQRRWLIALIAVGVVLRLSRYLLRFPLWEDEGMLSANFLDRGYAGLLQPLYYCQVAPVLFLWGQLTLTKLFGFNEYILRLVPFLCGLGSLFLFRHVAARLLQGVSLVLAVGLFAVAYPMTRYAAEAKPYGCDLLVALAIIAITIEWLRRPDETKWLWRLAALVALTVGYSFPTIFIGGGASLVIAWSLWSGKRQGWRPWIALNAALAAGVLLVLVVKEYSAGTTMQQGYWTDSFPPFAHPLKLPLWLLQTHAGAMLGYPVGGPNWGSSFSLLCLLIGLGTLALRRKWLLLGLLLAPLGLNFIAAGLHRFPYGGHARMTMFLAPAFCTLIAYGLAAALVWLENRLAAVRPVQPVKDKQPVSVLLRRPNGLTIALAAFALLAAGSWVRDLTQPYKSGTTLRAREFAQWFWFEAPRDSEPVSCESDLKVDLMPGKTYCGWSALYLCNQRIYSTRLARCEKPDLARVSVQHPLRCLLYRSPIEEQSSPSPDPHARDHWLEKMEAQYELVGHDAYPFAAYDKSDSRQTSSDYVEVFKFVPRGGGGAVASASGQTVR